MGLSISIDDIKTLRQLTGAGVMDCKRALGEAQGDLEKAREILKKLGLATATKKAERETREGIIHSYVHSGNRLGALVEINCESDFVARTPEVRELAHNLAMQVAAMAPRYISQEEIVEGEDHPPQEVCLLEQPYIKDPTRTVKELVQEVIARVQENIRVRRFARFALGE